MRARVILLALGLGCMQVQGQTPSLENDIQSLLAERCHKCHAGDERRGGFSMDSRESFLAGGEFGDAVVPGNNAASLLIELVTSDDPEEWMPPKGDRLTPDQIASLRAWIDAGIPWSAPATGNAPWQTPLRPRAVKMPKRKGLYGSKHPIDRFIGEYAEANTVELGPVVGDRQFIRRVYLDILGLLPAPESVAAFVQSRKRNKRTLLVDSALADTRSYAEHWITFWNDALRNDFQGTGYIDGGRKQITAWLYRALDENRPYNEFVADLVAPTRQNEGFIKGIQWRGATSANQQTPLQAARNVSKVFLGVNLKCTSCHDSFIDDWKLADAYGLANAFSDTPLQLFRCDLPTGTFADTRFLWPELGSIVANAPLDQRRRQVAKLVTDSENGRFSRMIVNRIWAAMMGRGLVEPRTTLDAEPWNADILDWLANAFVESGYDSRSLIRLIATSATYQLQSDSRPPADDSYIFAGPLPRRLSAEQFYDAMSCVMGVWRDEPKYTPRPRKESASTDTTRAWRVPADPLMRTLGRPNREQVVLRRETTFTRVQALELTNGDTLAEFLAHGTEHLLNGGPVDSTALFAHAIGRPPEDAERDIIESYGRRIDRQEPLEDLLWVLFNHPEFQVIH